MANHSSWTKEELIKLYELRNIEGMRVIDVCKELGRSQDSVSKKYRRINWEEFMKDPDSYLKRENSKKISRPWTQEEMLQFDAYLQAGKSYYFISEKLDRGVIAVERKAQQINWKAWRALVAEKELAEEVENLDVLKNEIINSLLIHSRYDSNRLHALVEDEFLEKVNLEKEKLPLSFIELKKAAEEELTVLGFNNPESIDLKAGTYVILGDSHGKHTKNEVFSLLKQVNKFVKPKKIIHMGHILDDDNDISYNWGKLDNLVILPKLEELKIVQEQRNQGKFNFEVVRENINIGDLVLMNQDMITDYVKTPIRSLDAQLFDQRVIVNCHRLEFVSRCTYEDKAYIASPGCLCEQHVIKTVKQIDFTDGRHVKQAYWEGFSKYRRMRHMNKYWEQGMIIVNIDKKGRHTIIPCPMKKIGKNYAISYFNKIITSQGVYNPDTKIFVNSDLHSDKQDCNVLDIQEQIVKDYKPDKYVNLGDTHNYHSLNHHVMDRGAPIVDKKILDEAAQTHHVIKRCAEWSKDNYMILGNHERFATDFVEKYPQFGKYLSFEFLCGLSKLNYKLVEMKDVLTIGKTKFIHGEIRMYGQPGSKLEKASRTFGKDIFVGHIHYPGIRFGCFSLGLTGELDQDYNEPQASQWMHGFGFDNQYKGHSFLTTIAIVENACVLNGKTYIPKKPSIWKVKKFDVELCYKTE